jgi:hypothetical protein
MGFFSVMDFVTTGNHWLEYGGGFPLWGLLAGRFSVGRSFWKWEDDLTAKAHLR